jgi:hypothetical protein
MMVLLVLPMIFWALHGTGLSPRELFAAAKAPFLSALVAVLVGFGTRYLVGDRLPAFPKLVIESAALFSAFAGALLYVGGQWRFYLDLVQQLRRRS